MNKEKIAVGIVAAFAMAAIGLYGYFMSTPPPPAVPLSIFEESPVAEEEVVNEDRVILEPIATTTFGATYDGQRAPFTFTLPDEWFVSGWYTGEITKEYYDSYTQRYGVIVNSSGEYLPYEVFLEESTTFTLDKRGEDRTYIQIKATKIREGDRYVLQEVVLPASPFKIPSFAEVKKEFNQTQGVVINGKKWVCGNFLTTEGSVSIGQECFTMTSTHEYSLGIDVNFPEEDARSMTNYPGRRELSADELVNFQRLYPAMTIILSDFQSILENIQFKE